jgi:formylglycine-generating enzyme required for sulfatase activity
VKPAGSAGWLAGLLVLRLAGLAAVAGEQGRKENPDGRELVRRIHAKMVARAAGEKGAVEAYDELVPGAGGVKFRMVPVPAGKFRMGSPAGEKGRRDDEGPVGEVRLSAFWMGSHEVTWDLFMPWLKAPVPRYRDGSVKGNVGGGSDADAVSGPTSPYMDPTWGMGEQGYPVVGMTDHAALKFCQWLSAQTGHCYRLPTEAEWEYAARAGTVTAWGFGDDEAELGEHAWFYGNSAVEGVETTHPVGRKKPNAWGLFDMHGNVAEWTMDEYVPGGYPADGGVREDPWRVPRGRYWRVVRGGSWDDDPRDTRSAARRASRASWKAQDPQLPKSLWYLTNATFVGFRLVRPATIPSVEELEKIWNLGAVGEDRDEARPAER